MINKKEQEAQLLLWKPIVWHAVVRSAKTTAWYLF